MMHDDHDELQDRLLDDPESHQITSRYLARNRIRRFKVLKLVLNRHRLPITLVSLSTLLICTLLFQYGAPAAVYISTSLTTNNTTSSLDWKPLSPPSRISNLYGLNRPSVGSPEWLALYPPPRELGPNPRPEWLARYHHLKTLPPTSPLSYHPIKDFKQAILNRQNGLADYPPGTDMGGGPNGLCSFRKAGCVRPRDWNTGSGDILRGIPNTWAINFDDGPLPPSTSLYNFLDEKHETASHFWIGSNVHTYPSLALRAASRGDELLVHTWSHPHLTTLTDEQIIGELGWTMQIIVDISCSRKACVVPSMYRPPYGDVDDRVRWLAKNVLNLTTTIWSSDSSDWSLNQTYASGDFVDPPYANFHTPDSIYQIRNSIGSAEYIPNSPKDGVIILEHELSEESVQAFVETYDEVKEKWTTGTVGQCIRGIA